MNCTTFLTIFVNLWKCLKSAVKASQFLGISARMIILSNISLNFQKMHTRSCLIIAPWIIAPLLVKTRKKIFPNFFFQKNILQFIFYKESFFQICFYKKKYFFQFFFLLQKLITFWDKKFKNIFFSKKIFSKIVFE